MKIIRVLLIFNIVLASLSCEKEPSYDKEPPETIEPGETNDYRIKRIHFKAFKVGYYEFNYQGDRLVEMKKIVIDGDTTNSDYDNWTITYDGNIITKEYFEIFRSGMYGDEIHVLLHRDEYTVETDRVVQILKYETYDNWDDFPGPMIYKYVYMNGKLNQEACYEREYTDDKLTSYKEYNYYSDTLVEYIDYDVDGNRDTIRLRTGWMKSHEGLLKEVRFLYRPEHPARDTITIKYYYGDSKNLIKTVEDNREYTMTNEYQYNNEGLISNQTLIYYNYEYEYEYEKGGGNTGLIWHDPTDFVFKRPNDIDLISF